MAAEAEAAREARAKVIAAEGEQKASRALREASEVISDSPAALQLRYLQVNKRISNNLRLKKKKLRFIKLHFFPNEKFKCTQVQIQEEGERGFGLLFSRILSFIK